MIEWIKHIIAEWKWDQGHIVATIAIPAFIFLFIHIIWESVNKNKDGKRK
jgi:hypothetical protein